MSRKRPVGEVTVAHTDRSRLDVQGGIRRLPALSSRLAPRPTPANSAAAAPAVSVVVATTFTRTWMLERCVRALAALDYPDYEVIVVDNRVGHGHAPGADQADWRALCRTPRVRVVAQPRAGASAARNVGLAEATGVVVAFTDDDVEVDPGWLRALADRFAREPEADCVTGLVLPAELETPAQIWFERSGNAFAARYDAASFARRPGIGRFAVTNRYAPDPDRPMSMYRLGEFGTGCNMAWRTSVLRDLGGFDEALGPGTPAGAGEDILLFLRLLSRGGRLAYEPGAFVWHQHRRDAASLIRQTRAYGMGLTAMLTAAVRKDPAHLWGLAQVIGPGVGLLARGESTKDPAPPRVLVRVKRHGMLVGPFAYLLGMTRHLDRARAPWRPPAL